jgi:hypothetical protein
MSKAKESLQNISNMNEYLREINRQRQGRGNHGTRKVGFREKVNVRLFHHMSEPSRRTNKNNQSLSNNSGKKLPLIPRANTRRRNIKAPLEWEHYHYYTGEPNEPRNHRSIYERQYERSQTRRLLNYLQKHKDNLTVRH